MRLVTRFSVLRMVADARRLIERHKVTLICRHEAADGYHRITICGLWKIEKGPEGTVTLSTLDLLREVRKFGGLRKADAAWVKAEALPPGPMIPLLGRDRGNDLDWAYALLEEAIKTVGHAVAGSRSRESGIVEAVIRHLSQEIIGWKDHSVQETWHPGTMPACSIKTGGRTLRAVLFDHVLDPAVISAAMAIDYRWASLADCLTYVIHRDGLLKIAREHRNLLPLLRSGYCGPVGGPAGWEEDGLFSQARWVRRVNHEQTWYLSTPAGWRWLMRAPARVVFAWSAVECDPVVIDNIALANVIVRVPVVALVCLVRASESLVRFGMDPRIQRLYRLFLGHCADLWREKGHAAVKRWLSEKRLSLVIDWLAREGLARGQPDRQATWASLCRRSDDWHARIALAGVRHSEDDDDLSEARWPALLPETVIGGVVFRPLTAYSELRDEGRALHHCVASYEDVCRDGRYAVFAVTEPDGVRSTLGLCLDVGEDGPARVRLHQHFGLCNSLVSATAGEAADRFVRLCRKAVEAGWNTACPRDGCPDGERS